MRALTILAALLCVGAAQPGGPRNDLPQPYQTTRDWGELPAAVKWAAVTAVEPAPDGSIYVIHRCFANSCANRAESPILKYTAAGKLLAQWGAKMFIFPHGATVDRGGNLWVADARGENGIGHQVFKFSPNGEVLMTLGKAGVSGSTPDLFDQPTETSSSHRVATSSSPTAIATAGTTASCDSRETATTSRSGARRDLGACWMSGGSSGSRAGSSSRRTTRSTSPIRNRAPIPARASFTCRRATPC